MKYLIVVIVGIFLMACNLEKKTKTWTMFETVNDSAPIARHEAAFTKVGDKMYLLGGREIRPVSIYDSKANTWTKGAKPPIEIHHFQPIVYNKEIYIIGAFTGGWPNETPIETIMKYSPANDKWSFGDSIPKSRLRGAAGAVINGSTAIISCGLADGHIGDHKRWVDSYDFKSKKWEILPDAPRSRDHFNAVIANDQMYLIGGRNTETSDNPFGNTIKEVDVFDLNSETWSTTTEPLPHPRAGNTAILYHEEILVIGGESDSQEAAHADIDALNVNNNTWRSMSPMIQGRHGTGAIIFEDNIYVASGCGKRGGEPELANMEVFSHSNTK